MGHTLAIGEVAERTGLAVSAIRFYEERGLIASERSERGHRRFRRATIRRLSFIMISQSLGYTLREISEMLEALPAGRTPTEGDWQRFAERFASDVAVRIEALERLRDKLDGCIGCGCLSLEVCGLWNADDAAAKLGSGPRWLLGDRAPVDR
ncbi:MAG: redox-sensitive transcriptional activator SoxR [Acidimicrobiales bacterium]|nr:redox-sensitive transcriptional activator SoxR [Acidimicrobiales bacterium]